jgi:tRNA G37 N-methylase Trm5
MKLVIKYYFNKKYIFQKNSMSKEEEEKLKEEISKITWENYGEVILNTPNKFNLTFKERQFIKILLSRNPPTKETRRKVK